MVSWGIPDSDGVMAQVELKAICTCCPLVARPSLGAGLLSG